MVYGTVWSRRARTRDDGTAAEETSEETGMVIISAFCRTRTAGISSGFRPVVCYAVRPVKI